MIAAPASGQGKTTITLGLLRALRRLGVDVVSGKSGPDYIDPGFHAAATGRPCVTLDAWGSTPDQIRNRAALQGAHDLLMVEGAMGLFDGADTGGIIGDGASAQVAEALRAPVVLVLDAAHMGQTAGAIVSGLARWSSGVEIAGVILNRCSSARHLSMMRRAIEPTCPILGVVPREAALVLPSRHLGLVQAGETEVLEEFLDTAAVLMAERCNLDALLALARPVDEAPAGLAVPPLGQRIAIAQDRAFSFCYWHQIRDWQRAGAEISVFSPLADEAPDDAADAVFLPGGYPELHAGTLSGAGDFRSGVRRASARGALIYGECGGYMTLGQGMIDADGRRHAMIGLLDLETSFAERRRHLGYRGLMARAGPWGQRLKGHEFHYATTLRAKGDPLFDTTDGSGAGLGPTGLIKGTVMGSFMHIIDVAGPSV